MIRVSPLGLITPIRLFTMQHGSNMRLGIVSFVRLWIRYSSLNIVKGGVLWYPTLIVCQVRILLHLRHNFDRAHRSFLADDFCRHKVAKRCDRDDRFQQRISTKYRRLVWILTTFQRRLGHMCYDTIIKMDRDISSVIVFNDTKRNDRFFCAQGTL